MWGADGVPTEYGDWGSDQVPPAGQGLDADHPAFERDGESSKFEVSTELATVFTNARKRSLQLGDIDALRFVVGEIAEVKAGGVTSAFLDRLTLTQARVDAMADGVAVVRGIADPAGAEDPPADRFGLSPHGETLSGTGGA